MKVKIALEIQVDHHKDGGAHSCPELVAKRVKESLDEGFASGWFISKYMMATSVKVTEVTEFDSELEKKGAWSSKWFGTR